MKTKGNILVLGLLFFVVCSEAIRLSKRAVPSFTAKKVSTVRDGHVDEASGLAASHEHPGYLYTHNDSGDGPNLYLIKADTGELKATHVLHGATSKDWEDIAVSRCSPHHDDYCVYIADTGNAGHSGAENIIYKIPEPGLHSETINIHTSNKLMFSWSSGNSEAMCVDPDTNVYVISKSGHGHGKIAMLDPSNWGTGHRVHVDTTYTVGVQSTVTDPVACDISHDGSEILVKTRHALWYWNAGHDRDYPAIMSRPGHKVAYHDEPQGEAVCWDKYGRGYYTLSENDDQPLYYYTRS